MSKTEKRINYHAGITRTPSDFLCEDGELAECINLTTDHEELKVTVNPKQTTISDVQSGSKLLFVHKLDNGVQNYIFESSTGYYLRFNSSNITGSYHAAALKVNQIRAIGKTIIAVLDDKLTYFLYKNGSYIFLGNNIPCPRMAFGMSGELGNTVSYNSYSSYFKWVRGDGEVSGIDGEGHITDQKVYDNSVKGLYASTKQKAYRQKAFVLPFFIRYALKLYDDSYTHISNPIPMFPSSGNSCMFTVDAFYVHAMYAVYQNLVTYNDWTDIVKSISIFVSAGIELYDLSLDAVTNSVGDYWEHAPTRFTVNGPGQEDVNRINGYLPFEYRTPSELQDELVSESVFYHLCDLSATTQVNSWEQLRNHFSHITLENLATQDQLPYDNFHSLAPLGASVLYDYNGRLNLAHVTRGFFAGFTSFSGLYTISQSHTYQVYVRIASESGSRVVYTPIDATSEGIGEYIFYPDPRANHITVYQGSNCILDADLKEHPGLNGAYYSRGWPDPNSIGAVDGSAFATLGPSDLNNSPEELFGHIVTSEANNPFVFRSTGYNRIGSGMIIGMTSQTRALSQGQFGEYPLLVFTTEGIWAMSVGKEGLYDSVSPMSREVALPANPCITQTDGAVFFMSKKGLMLINGGDVVCVSELINGLAFNTNDIPSLKNANVWEYIIEDCADDGSFFDYINTSDCFLAYDYVDSRILIMRGSRNYSYVYNIRDRSISKLYFTADRAVNCYPDCLIQKAGAVFSLYDKPRDEDVNSRSQGFLFTRPMKLSGPVSVQSLRELVNVGFWSKKSGSVVKSKVFLSDNLEDWYEMKSRFGAAAKYFRIALYIEMKPTERLSGTIIRTQERRDDNARV